MLKIPRQQKEQDIILRFNFQENEESTNCLDQILLAILLDCLGRKSWQRSTQVIV